MDTTATTTRTRTALAGLLSAALVASAGFADRADSKRFSQKVIKTVSKKRLAGAYSGVSEEGTPVSFRLARSGKIVDFVVPITLGCTKENADLDGDGRINDEGTGEITKHTKPLTFRSAPLPGRKAEPHFPLGMTFEYETPLIPSSQPPLGTEVLEYSIKAKFEGFPDGSNIYRPIPKSAAKLEGELFIGSRNGPLAGQAVPGRELCSLAINGRTSTHVHALDFDAKKTGR